jgi:hypothetical protein
LKPALTCSFLPQRFALRIRSRNGQVSNLPLHIQKISHLIRVFETVKSKLQIPKPELANLKFAHFPVGAGLKPAHTCSFLPQRFALQICSRNGQVSNLPLHIQKISHLIGIFETVNVQTPDSTPKLANLKFAHFPVGAGLKPALTCSFFPQRFALRIRSRNGQVSNLPLQIHKISHLIRVFETVNIQTPDSETEACKPEVWTFFCRGGFATRPYLFIFTSTFCLTNLFPQWAGFKPAPTHPKNISSYPCI